MSSPAEWYQSLPPISKAYGTLCVIATTAFQLGLYDWKSIALVHRLVFSHLQVWRLFTNFFFLGNFSVNFGIRLLMIARYGVQLEKGPFDRRTADFLWMMIFGATTLLAFYLPWAMLALDVIFGSPIMPDLLGIIAGHLFYFLTVLHPLAGGKNILQTPRWVRKIVARWRIGAPPPTSRTQPPPPAAAGVSFRGRSYRLSE
ncbi:derlin-1-like isoform X2 [Malus sylvestris]|uniref:derlin-1-like isoform X2 n=1 Tax=Malus sylvestris TaxID=3752 RepID=UPI0021ABA805|nr:derlin-1-like isoform X2 [Malus sylvestris]